MVVGSHKLTTCIAVRTWSPSYSGDSAEIDNTTCRGHLSTVGKCIELTKSSVSMPRKQAAPHSSMFRPLEEAARVRIPRQQRPSQQQDGPHNSTVLRLKGDLGPKKQTLGGDLAPLGLTKGSCTTAAPEGKHYCLGRVRRSRRMLGPTLIPHLFLQRRGTLPLGENS